MTDRDQNPSRGSVPAKHNLDELSAIGKLARNGLLGNHRGARDADFCPGVISALLVIQELTPSLIKTGRTKVSFDTVLSVKRQEAEWWIKFTISLMALS